ncbi:MAG: hypothetical protein WCJ58_04725 [bacterium]
MNPATDQDLMSKARFDVNTFLELTDKYFTEIYSYIFNRLAISSSALELTESVFKQTAELLTAKSPIKDSSFLILLLRLANQEIVKYLESHELDDKELARFECNETQQFIIVLLQTLDAEMQNMISLKFYTSLSNAEIAEVLHFNATKLKQLMDQALSAYKKAHLKFDPDNKQFDFI